MNWTRFRQASPAWQDHVRQRRKENNEFFLQGKIIENIPEGREYKECERIKKYRPETIFFADAKKIVKHDPPEI